MAEVIIHLDAEAEYASALIWYANRSARAAARFANAFSEVVENVAQNPVGYPECDDDHRRCQLRKYPYAIVSRIDGDRVLIVAVPHDRQLPGFWQGRSSP